MSDSPEIEIIRIASQETLEAYLRAGDEVAISLILEGAKSYLLDHGFRRLALLSRGFSPDFTPLVSDLKKAKKLMLMGLHISDSEFEFVLEASNSLQSLSVIRGGLNTRHANLIAKNLPNLTELWLQANLVGDAGAKAIAKGLPNLTTLFLYENNVGDDGAQAIAEGMPNLTSLALVGNRVGDSGAQAIAEGLPHLATLSLAKGSVRKAGAQAIAEGLPNLTALNLSDNSLGDVGAKAIAEGLPNLIALDLAKNRLSEAGAQAISERLLNLESLNLYRNSVGDSGARAIAERLPSVTTLNLAGNNVGNTGTKAIAEGLPNLSSLNLYGIRVSHVGAQAIAEGLPNLTTLNLNGSGVGDDGALAIAKGLPNLAKLNLQSSGVGEVGAKAIAKGLPNLAKLNLQSNGVGDVGAKAIAEGLPNLGSLILSNNRVGDAGAQAIAEGLPNLTELWLQENLVGDAGAKAIAKGLPNLTTLFLYENNVGDDGAQAIAEGLPNLTALFLNGNNVGDAGAKAIAEGLPILAGLDLSGNSVGSAGAKAILDNYQFRFLSLLDLSKNPCTDQLLTKATFQSSDAKALLAAWTEFVAADASGTLVPLNEAKLLVLGDEAVGKTSLARFLLEGKARDPNERKTPNVRHFERIETRTWLPDGSDIRLNVWDFGGQEIMRGTHRYFLTERSLYILVLEDRREDDDSIDPWLRMIHSSAGNVPILVVINKCDGGKADLRIDEPHYQREYPQIIGFYRISCNDDKYSKQRAAALRAVIANTLVVHEAFEAARTPQPSSWLAVKEALTARAREESVLEATIFNAICVDPEVVGDRPLAGDDERRSLLRTLHAMGVVVAHGLGRDAPAALKGITLLDPNWLTDAIYEVLDRIKTEELGGRFTRASIAEWLNPKVYPIEHHEFIISMMLDEKIELCYRLPDEKETYLAPEALRVKSPDYSAFERDALRFRYRYKDLPRALVPRLIVRLHDRLRDPEDAWLTGAKLRIDDAEAVIRADRDAKRIDIAIQGERCREALAVLRDAFLTVHKALGDLEATAWVPMPDNPEIEESYDFLLRLEREEEPDYRHRPTDADHSYKISELLHHVDLRLVQQGEAEFPSTPQLQNDVNRSFELPSFQQIFPFVPAIYVLGVLLLDSEMGWSVSIGAAIVVFMLVRYGLRLLDPAYFFRRLFQMWALTGAALLGARGIAMALDLGWFSANIGDSVTITAAVMWIVAFMILGLLAHNETHRKQ
ncbi:COR domain-containing protein [Roseibium sp. MMSF_3544]|uniref:COR domain-containing protein n=1 Tax=unclassified Roseibium TaxID=2629323 RepID=UPI00273D7790|nr:COR domain-containing protein [Roseibium sp. MMSF_3544]